MKHDPASTGGRLDTPLPALQQQLLCIELVQACADLMDELQRERGLSQLAASPQAESYAAAFREQVGLSREAGQVLHKKLQELESLHVAGRAELEDLVRAGRSTLDSPTTGHLTHIRQGVPLLRCHREQAFAGYSSWLQELLQLTRLTRAAVQDVELVQELASLEYLMLFKEYSGQERASGAGQLTADRHDAQAWLHTLTLIEAQQRCASRFISQTRPAARKLLKEALSPETQTELENLRQRMANCMEGERIEPGLAAIWFRTCSRRMNELRAVERGLLWQMQHDRQQKLERLVVLASPEDVNQADQRTSVAIEAVLRTAAAWLKGEPGQAIGASFAA